MHVVAMAVFAHAHALISFVETALVSYHWTRSFRILPLLSGNRAVKLLLIVSEASCVQIYAQPKEPF